MKRTVFTTLIALISVSIMATSCGQGGGKATLKSDVDSAAYAIGVLNGEGMRQNMSGLPGDSLDVELILKGLTHGLRNKGQQITAEDANVFLQEYFTTAQERAVEKQVEKEQELIAKNKEDADVVTTASGLQYKITKLGTGVKPLETDTVEIHYTGTDINGEVFDSSVERGEPAKFALNQVIPGWTEGVQLMPEGSKFILWIPGNLAYGEAAPANPYGPPTGLLKFECELLKVIPASPEN